MEKYERIPQLTTYAHTNVNRSRTCRMLTAITKAYASVFAYVSRMNFADPPSEMPNTDEQQARIPRPATSRIGQRLKTFVGVRYRGFR
jgi:hypothetical protein